MVSIVTVSSYHLRLTVIDKWQCVCDSVDSPDWYLQQLKWRRLPQCPTRSQLCSPVLMWSVDRMTDYHRDREREKKLTVSTACKFLFFSVHSDMILVCVKPHHKPFGADEVNAGGVVAHLPVHLTRRAVRVLQHQLIILYDHGAFFSHAHVTDGHFCRRYSL